MYEVYIYSGDTDDGSLPNLYFDPSDDYLEVPMPIENVGIAMAPNESAITVEWEYDDNSPGEDNFIMTFQAIDALVTAGKPLNL